VNHKLGLTLYTNNKMKNYNDLAYYEKFACISLYPEEAKKDEEGLIRLAAYRALGFPEEAKKDEDADVRLEAYRALGFTEEAKQDPDWAIREEADIYFRVKNAKSNEATSRMSTDTIDKTIAEMAEKAKRADALLAEWSRVPFSFLNPRYWQLKKKLDEAIKDFSRSK